MAEEGKAALTAREIEKMTVTKLREEALKFPDRLTGVHGMSKQDLIRALKTIHGIPIEESERRAAVDKTALKQRIRSLKALRNRALEEGDRLSLKRARQRIKALKRKLARVT